MSFEIERARANAKAVLNRWIDSMQKMPTGISAIEIECLKTMLTAAFREYEDREAMLALGLKACLSPLERLSMCRMCLSVNRGTIDKFNTEIGSLTEMMKTKE